MCLASMILGPDTLIDGWQIKTAVWLGAVPPVVLMVILYRKSRQVLSSGSPESFVPMKKEGIQ
jgi:hypothetical protein